MIILKWVLQKNVWRCKVGSCGSEEEYSCKCRIYQRREISREAVSALAPREPHAVRYMSERPNRPERRAVRWSRLHDSMSAASQWGCVSSHSPYGKTTLRLLFPLFQIMHTLKLAPTCFGPYIYDHIHGSREQCFVSLLSWIPCTRT